MLRTTMHRTTLALPYVSPYSNLEPASPGSRGAFATQVPARFLLLIVLGVATLIVEPVRAQNTMDPFDAPIEQNEGVVVVDVEEFAVLPDHEGAPARMMGLIDEPTTGMLFVYDMYGKIFRVSYDGSEAELYLDLTDYGVQVESGGRERGFQSFAIHPDFGNPDAPGYGHFYTYSDVSDTDSEPDFTTPNEDVSHHTVLHEWIAEDPEASMYDGDAPRELIRLEQPYGNHNAGHIAFGPEDGLLYVGVADGGSGGDPMNLAQNLGSAFGKLFRIDPLGSNSANGAYGIPADNPFVNDAGVLDEIYAYGVRNPQRFGWDAANGNLYLTDIGQNAIEKVTLVPRGGNLGWNVWEGSYRYAGGGVNASDPRSDADVTYPVAEWAHADPLTTGRSAATGVHVFRSGLYPDMEGRLLFGDFVSGELFHVSADQLPDGGNDEIRRMLLRTPDGEVHTFLEILQQKNREQDRTPTQRTDLRIDADHDGRVFLLNKHDGVIRVIR